MIFKTRKKAHPFIIGLIIFMLAMEAFLLLLAMKIPMAGLAFAFWTVATVSLFLQSFAWYTRYEFSGEKLLLRGVYKKRWISLSEIKSFQHVDGNVASHILNDASEGREQGQLDADIGSWWQSVKKFDQLTSFCTIQSFSKSGNDEAMGATAMTETVLEGDFIVLTLKSDEAFLLSPVDVAGMVSHLENQAAA